jgi:O-acetyl-ADP-ribose deacetylase (regulator of RNase III)
MSGIRLWQGDVCDLETDAIVVPATPALWMTNGVAASVKQRGGHGIEFEAVGRAPVPIGTAIATGAGTLACRHVIHAVSQTAERRTTPAAIEAATCAAILLADELGDRVVALPSLGSPLGGVAIAEGARIMIGALHESLSRCRVVDEVVLALRSGPTYDAFLAELDRRRAPRSMQVEADAHGPLVGVMRPPPGDETPADDGGGPADRADQAPGGVEAGRGVHPEGVR